MQDVLYVEAASQAGALLHPLRIEVLKKLAEPKSCPELARELDETTQKVYYHVKILETAGLVEKVEERRVRGIMEGLYRARAKSYWLSPSLAGKAGGAARARDHLSLGFLLSLAEEIHEDVARLGERTGEGETVPSLGLSLSIELAGNQSRARFLQELKETFQALAKKYAARRGDSSEAFQLSVVCYPRPFKERSSS
jgi:DNA-binding transcriptional ArsR family regulator